MSKQEYIDRFLAASWLYFRLRDKSGRDINQEDVEEMVELIDADYAPMLCPDQHIA